jgi:hypothetical protein
VITKIGYLIIPGAQGVCPLNTEISAVIALLIRMVFFFALGQSLKEKLYKKSVYKYVTMRKSQRTHKTHKYLRINIKHSTVCSCLENVP